MLQSGRSPEIFRRATRVLFISPPPPPSFKTYLRPWVRRYIHFIATSTIKDTHSFSKAGMLYRYALSVQISLLVSCHVLRSGKSASQGLYKNLVWVWLAFHQIPAGICITYLEPL